LQRAQGNQSNQEQELQAKIRDGEMMCGRLLQQYLEIADALELKKKHVKEDKARLARVHQTRERTTQEINSIMDRASGLMRQH
jgi:hypothetical protein